MKTIVIIITAVLLLAVVAFFVLGVMSKNGSAAGLSNGQLTRCPDKPNCVCSEYPDDEQHAIAALTFPNSKGSQALEKVKQALIAMGGTIQQENDHYLAATFKSRIFGFVDDVEVRWDATQQVMHIRSASRVGYSDAGVNRQRVTALRARLGRT